MSRDFWAAAFFLSLPAWAWLIETFLPKGADTVLPARQEYGGFFS